MRHGLIIITLWLCATPLRAQEMSGSRDLQYVSDELVPYPDEDVNYEELYENLAQILASPYDLNRVTREELQMLHILNDAQIKNFLDYRRDQGVLLDIHELQVIPDFDMDVIRKLMPYVSVVDPASRISGHWLRSVFSADNSYVVMRYERTLKAENASSDPDDGPVHFGSPDKMYLRFRSAESGNYSMGFTAEKDAGEKMSFEPKNNQWGSDFTSWHAQIRNKGKIRNIIAGDFQTQFAQGLVFGGAFSLGKGGESVATTRRSHAGFLPYTSINESAYQRGLALSLDIARDVTMSLFYSHTKRDGALENDADTVVVRSIQTSGYHRTPSEVSNRKTIAEQNSGAVLHLRKKNFDAGLLFNLINFQFAIKKSPTLYNQHAFKGSSNANAGFFLNYTFENISFFSEVAQTIGAGRAIIAGALVTPHRNLEVAMLYRDYARDYHAFYANAFSENTQPQNERGIYWGWKYRWSRRVSTSGYVDLFAFPWLAFRRYSPSQGYEWLLRLSYQPSRKTAMFIQVREESKPRNLGNGVLYKVADGIKRNVGLHCDFGIGEMIRLKSRIQYNIYDHGGNTTEGLAVTQDASLSIGRFKFSGRHGLFHTESYDNRHYVYESDAWLSYSLPAYSGFGVRNYALIEIRIHKQLTVWLRYARTRLLKERDASRVPQPMEGNPRNDVKFQARFTF